MIKRAFSSLITWIISFQLISVIIGYITKFGMYPWYGQLIKSSLTPPGYYFGIIWPLLYISLAILGWKLYKEKETTILKWYWIGMLLNWLWSPIFFTWHLSCVALSILISLVAINAYILIKLRIRYTNYAYMMLPYFLWLCFALYLNLIIVLSN
jgi:tryptophan-rich sensory protein